MNPKPPVFDDINPEILVISTNRLFEFEDDPGLESLGICFGYSTYNKEHLCQISACYHFWLGFSTHRPDY